MSFSIYSKIDQQDKHKIIQQESRKPLKTKHIPNLQRNLKSGWLLLYLYHYDAILHGRWEYWSKLQLVPASKIHFLYELNSEKRKANIQQHILPPEPIPQIFFSEDSSLNCKGDKMIQICLEAMLTKGGYGNLLARIEYLLDWLLYGFGHPISAELPQEPDGCQGCSMALYQLFDLFPLLYQPQDYWGYLIAEAKGTKSQKHTGFFPTPISVSTMMAKMLINDSLDSRLNVAYEPAIGTGTMTLELSNHTLNIVGVDVDKLLLKATLVNWFLYCPWFAMPVFYLVEQTDLLWGNALVSQEDPNAPQSIHQKYWKDRYQDICSVNLSDQNLLEAIKDFNNLLLSESSNQQLKQVNKAESESSSIFSQATHSNNSSKSQMPKRFKRANSTGKPNSLF
ncbi:MAG: hypothetical protein AAFQ80_07830 [Cyanobacteria bacterium J06621_8]